MGENENRETASDQQGPAALGGVWPDGQAMSPMVIFDPQRITYCAEFRAHQLDGTVDPLRAHLAAAKRHLVEAGKEAVAKGGRGDRVEYAIRRVDELIDNARREIMWKL